ncbi:MAG: prolipoprotein diacylglyceryl transferase [Alphaproteobacteria bacterium]|nr:prolipoprotein diacylglyceryl transferase [Alphaproteobacteria bacterium]
MFWYDTMSVIGAIAAFLTAKALDMPKPDRRKRFDIYIVAVAGFIIGAKLPVWLSYGLRPDLILSGKSIMGAMLGAFVALNLYKRHSGQRDEAFGGRFAIPLAVAVGFGKIGCYLYGCCGGHFFVPVQLVESAFQFTMAGALYLFYRRTGRVDLLFPLYLIAYMVMRFFIEFVRTEPRVLFDLTIYQYLSLLFLPIVLSVVQQRRAPRWQT